MDNIKIEFLKNMIFVFTPKGDAKELPDGSTPIDFAYAVHDDIGDHIQSIKINGRIGRLDHKLIQGDVVEVITSKKAKPSPAWLRIVKTAKARNSIKRFLAIK